MKLVLKKIIKPIYIYLINLIIVKLIRKFYFSIIGFFFKCFIYYNNEIPKDDVIILGRGKSLNEYKKNYTKFNFCKNLCLVNFSDSDLVGFNKAFLKNKIIHFFINSTEPTISLISLYKSIIGKSYLMRTKNDSLKDIKFYNSRKYGNYVEYLPEEFKYLSNKYHNSGLLTIAIVANIWKPKKIYLFGFNFYQDDMHNKTLKEEMIEDDHILGHVKHGKIMKKQLDEIIKNNKNINFYQY